MDSLVTIIFVSIVVVLLAAVYFMPTWVAWKMRHHNVVAIGVLNLLAGWTFIGWVGALVWSLTRNKPGRAV